MRSISSGSVKSAHVMHRNQIYVYSPTKEMVRTFYYPLRVGVGEFRAGYHLSRAPMDNFLIAYISEGAFRIRFGDVDAVASAGQFLIVDCYQPHVFSTNVKCKDIWLHYDGPTARATYEYMVNRLGGHILEDNDEGEGLRELRIMLSLLKGASHVPESVLGHHIDGLVTALSNGHEIAERVAKYADMDNVLAYISAHLDDDLSLETLSKIAMMDKSYFCKCFKARTGSSPHKFVAEARLRYAKYLLRATDLSIAGIGRECGFGQANSFGVMFRAMVGCSPTAFRKGCGK